MDVRMAAALAGAVPNVARFCGEQGISRQTFYKWRRRFAEGGVEALQERSRRPATSPGACAGVVQERIVFWRKRLVEDGADHGADSIAWQLARDQDFPPGQPQPGRATIWRVLRRRGLITPEPKKRPRSSLRRFTYPRPNDCWQSDWTEWALADGTQIAIAATLDDHSRYLVAISAASGDGTIAQIWAVFLAGISDCGIPARSLSDNGLVYSGRRRGIEVATERNLRALGIQQITSTPGHPQTCGKIERFWQTLKTWLRARPTPATLTELNDLLTTFRAYYNHQRPHRALRGTTPNATPAEAFSATTKARPPTNPIPAPVFIDHSHVTRKGTTCSGDYQIHVGVRWEGHPTHAIRQGNHIIIFTGAHLLRDLHADPTRTYQGAPTGTPRAKHRYREPLTP
jgi:transposase InsO family protein